MSSPSARRSALWFCYECHAEMRPLMNPDPHCASCNGTFIEEMDGTGGEDIRQIARENEQSHAFLDMLNGGLFGPPLGPRSMGGGRRMASEDPFGSPNRPPRLATPMGGGGNGVLFELRSGTGGRTWTLHTGNDGRREHGSNRGPGGPLPADFPSFPEFVHQRMGSLPTSPVDDEIETPYGPRSRRARELGGDPVDDPRALLMQYLMGMLSGNPALMFQHPEGAIPGGGAFGDYVFSQEGLDRIVTQLMEAAGQHKPNPAPDEMIASLKRTQLTYDCDLVKSGQSCAICTEYFAPPESSSAQNDASKAPEPDENSGPSSRIAIALPCGHPFHDDCITTWLKTNGTCPVCRYALVEQPDPNGRPGATSNAPLVPGAASTSGTNTNTNSAPRFPEAAPTGSSSNDYRANPRPAADRTTSSQSTADRTTSSQSAGSNSTPPTPQGQAETFFNTLGHPGHVLDSIFGFLGGHGGRAHRADAGSGSSATPVDQSGSHTGERSNDTTSQSRQRPHSPVFFWERRRSGQGSGNSPGSSRTPANNTGDQPSNSNNRHIPGGWDDVD